MLENTIDLIPKGSTVYIATDEPDKTFFEPFRKQFKLYFLDDFMDLLVGVNTNYYGFLDMLIASRGHVFIGAPFSTFTAYINRLRGYHVLNDRAYGYREGFLNRSYFYLKGDRDLVRRYEPVQPILWGREFPAAWVNIDDGTD